MKEAGQKPKTNKLAKRIQASLAGKASAQVTVKVTLTGTAAEVWLAIQKDAEGLGMDNKAILAALLDAGGANLRRALKEIPRT
jgi:DNA polymerase III delta subunit